MASSDDEPELKKRKTVDSISPTKKKESWYILAVMDIMNFGTIVVPKRYKSDKDLQKFFTEPKWDWLRSSKEDGIVSIDDAVWGTRRFWKYNGKASYSDVLMALQHELALNKWTVIGMGAKPCETVCNELVTASVLCAKWKAVLSQGGSIDESVVDETIINPDAADAESKWKTIVAKSRVLTNLPKI